MRTINLTPLALSLSLAIVIGCGGDDAPPADTAVPVTDSAPPAGPEIPTNVTLPPGLTQEMVTQGREIFTNNTSGNCLTCHGVDGSGTPLAPSLRDTVWINIGGSYEDIIGVVKSGVPQPKQHPAPMRR
jgi:mono/diheme cytochrome c family protein